MAQQKMMKEDTRTGLRNATASILANSIEHLLHPLDLIRVRFQSNDGSNKGNAVPNYKRISTALSMIFQEEGIRGMYKGLLVTLFSTNLSKFIYFGMYGYWRSMYQKDYGLNSKKATSYAALQAGFVATTALAPLWIIKTRMMLNTSDIRGHHNFIETVQQIYNQYGIKGYFRGLGISLLLSLQGTIQLTVYEYFKQLLRYQAADKSSESIKPFLCGAGSKIVSLTIIYPATLVRTRIQQNQFADGHKEPKYKGLGDVLFKTFKYEGVLGFYKGYSAALLRSLPSSAIFFFFFEFFNKKLPF